MENNNATSPFIPPPSPPPSPPYSVSFPPSPPSSPPPSPTLPPSPSPPTSPPHSPTRRTRFRKSRDLLGLNEGYSKFFFFLNFSIFFWVFF
ncbi:hypothetical protein RCL_jg5064.t1 [Rhizophagus clarus]|uniref:Uncharacterized protein n=1 Tax=Rhizophagus clarus TaxID=94130 RepID=A0A8H3L9R6_9GLOM|nr:hypothetical protein RCL_jg5064.t1 [Rhizophagus clarus]